MVILRNIIISHSFSKKQFLVLADKGGYIFMGKSYHITHNPNGGWKVLGAGNSKPTHILSTKEQAIKVGKRIAQNQQSELIIHGLNGKIQSSNSYGNDPYPPRG